MTGLPVCGCHRRSVASGTGRASGMLLRRCHCEACGVPSCSERPQNSLSWHCVCFRSLIDSRINIFARNGISLNNSTSLGRLNLAGSGICIRHVGCVAVLGHDESKQQQSCLLLLVILPGYQKTVNATTHQHFFNKARVFEKFALLPQKETRLVACHIRLGY